MVPARCRSRKRRFARQPRVHVRHRRGGGLQDDAEAVRWYRLAADQGHADAQTNLGILYATGRGVPQDETEEAVRLFRLASEQGDADAQLNLGVMYATGAVVLKDSVLAHMWSNISSANGNEAARTLRGTLERDMTRDEISRATETASRTGADVHGLGLPEKAKNRLRDIDHRLARRFHPAQKE